MGDSEHGTLMAAAMAESALPTAVYSAEGRLSPAPPLGFSGLVTALFTTIYWISVEGAKRQAN